MGTPDREPGRKPGEGPAHVVEIKPFYLAATEVARDLFGIYLQELGVRTLCVEGPPFPEDRDGISKFYVWYGDRTMGWDEKGLPAFAMSWRNAANFCKWLSKKAGKTYRLPTEVEWEYACRTGTKTAYSFGNDPANLGEYAWFTDNSGEDLEARPRPVAQKKPNAWGLYDMHGNVKEWVADFYARDAYAADAKAGPVANPTGPKQRMVHVARGGSYADYPEDLRSGAREFQEDWWQFEDPQDPKSIWWLPKRAFIGFRVACSTDGP
jgi:formylglycine-generating enzyme required for sulfatase activity